ncbi:MAG: C10 family peptidase, partial [Muribaculaceae bacterium]|nr:C10 family peptidase [Muribaculaceae bacterium]
CIATATAQAMKYFEYPAKGKGAVSVTVNGSSQTMNLSTVTFNWSNMLDSYAGLSYTTTQATAIATLMKAVGFAVNMNYGTSASGAYSSDIPTALINNFSYDAATAYYDRSYYSISEWEQMIYDNLKNCGPVIYGGASYEGGHSFICDGYVDGYFHINWGWGGMSDGYFLLTALDPSSQGIGGTNSAFIFQQDAILGMREPVSGSVPVTGMGIYGTLKGSVSGSQLTLPMAINPFSEKFNGAIGIRLVNQSTQAVTIVKALDIVNLACHYGYTSWSATLPTSLAAGTYKVYPVYTTKSSPSDADWKDMLIQEGSPRYILLTKTGNTYSVTNEEVKRFSVTDVQVNTEVYSGMPFSVTFTINNPNPYPRTAQVAPFFSRLNTVSAYGSISPISLEANETKTITTTYTLTPSTAAAGNYTMFIGEAETDDNTGSTSVYAVSSTQTVAIKKA